MNSEALLRKNKADAENAVAIAQGRVDAKIPATQGDAKALVVLGGASIKQYGAEVAKVKN